MEKKEKKIPARTLLSFPYWGEDFWDVDFAPNSGLSISEDKNSVYVEAHLPGLNPDDIEVSFENGVLWIHGERREIEEDKKKKFYRKASSSFSYRAHVPGQVDEKSEPKATFRDGVLKVTFKKTEKPLVKKISIKKEK